METAAQIDAQIEKLENDLTQVKGRETEVYARIVGYYRSVRNWNKGKREEYNYRKSFDSLTHNSDRHQTMDAAEEAVAEAAAEGSPARYAYFYRTTCPNCPPVKNALKDLPFDGDHVNVDEPAGLKIAGKHSVMAAPTVIFFDDEGNEQFRAHNTRDLEANLTAAAI